MKHMTLAEFIETESDEPVFIVDGPQPIVGTCDIETAKTFRYLKSISAEVGGSYSDYVRTVEGWEISPGFQSLKLAEYDHHFIKAHQ